MDKMVVHTYKNANPVSVQIERKAPSLQAFLDLEDWGNQEVVLKIWDHVPGTGLGHSGRSILLDLATLRNAISRAIKGATVLLRCKANPSHSETLTVEPFADKILLRVDEPGRPGPEFILPAKVLRRALSSLVRAAKAIVAV